MAILVPTYLLTVHTAASAKALPEVDRAQFIMVAADMFGVAVRAVAGRHRHVVPATASPRFPA